MNSVINKKAEYQYLGNIDYKKAWDYQTELFQSIIDTKIANRNNKLEEQSPTDNYLLFCHHPHVYTLGKSGSLENLLLTEEELKQKHIDFYKINRGGDITYHGPNQLVGYPILDLENFFTDIHKYMRLLEEAIIRMLSEYGLDSGRIDGLTGVWLDYEEQKDPRKICALGVKTSRWVTMHGFALNVNSDLKYFDYIVPCGIDDKAVTSMDKELGRKMDMDEVMDKVRHHLKELFEMQLSEKEAAL